jgi:putrescine aminotransferase
VVPPLGYLARARELCNRYGALLIADEIQTGMGRTGRLWGVDHGEVVPDIMCLGKALGGGVMPLSAFVSTPQIWEALIPNPVIHSTTFGGNPIACAAGIAAITVTLEEDLPGQAAAKGEMLLRELATLRTRYPAVLSACRGKGLLIGLEFPSDAVGYECAAALFRRGVLVAGTYSKARTIRIEPALDIPTPLLLEVLNRLEDVLRDIQARRFAPNARSTADALINPALGGTFAELPCAAPGCGPAAGAAVRQHNQVGSIRTKPSFS